MGHAAEPIQLTSPASKSVLPNRGFGQVTEDQPVPIVAGAERHYCSQLIGVH